MNPHSFLAELKRRNVYKVAVAYAVVAWLLIQAASILFPTFEAPSWVMKVFVVVVALGFPIALILAWAFEVTPEGIKRTEEIAPGESIAPRGGRKLVGSQTSRSHDRAGGDRCRSAYFPTGRDPADAGVGRPLWWRRRVRQQPDGLPTHPG
jgi:hypothetical protein